MIKLTHLCIFCSILLLGYAQQFGVTESSNAFGRPQIISSWQPQGQPNLQGPFNNAGFANGAPYPPPWANNNIPPANMPTYPYQVSQNNVNFNKNIADIFGKEFVEGDQQEGGGINKNFNTPAQNVNPMQGPPVLSGNTPAANTGGLRPNDYNLDGGLRAPSSPVASVGVGNWPQISPVTTPSRNRVNQPNNNRPQPPRPQGNAGNSEIGIDDFFKKEVEKSGKNFPDQRPQQQHIRYELPTKCGQRNDIEDINGIPNHDNNHAKYAEFPWMAAIMGKEKLVNLEYFSKCGGAIIAADVVVTVVHCISNFTAQEIKIRAGEWDAKSRIEPLPHQERQVLQIINHENFVDGSALNDIAILLLESPLVFQDNVQPICLPNNNENFDRQRCFVSGWGKDKWGRDGQNQNILKKIEIPIIPRLACRDSFRRTVLGGRFELHDSFICAGGEEDKDACSGDGGSPLACPMPGTTNHFKLAGLVAWGLECGKAEIPGAYVNVAKFVDWIKQRLAEARI